MWERYYALRRQYFQSKEFQESHSNRTLLLTLVPGNLQNLEALNDYLKVRKYGKTYLQAKRIRPMPRQIAFGRDTKILTKLVEDHDKLTVLLENAIIKHCNSGFKEVTQFSDF
jgi:hypothetical protein